MPQNFPLHPALADPDNTYPHPALHAAWRAQCILVATMQLTHLAADRIGILTPAEIETCALHARLLVDAAATQATQAPA